MKDDNDRLRDGTLPDDPFADAIPLDGAASAASSGGTSYRPFPVETLPEPVRSLVIEAASAIGCDRAYIALPALAGLAASIGNTRRIELKKGWWEPCVFWTAIVGESGTLKSPAEDVALAPLKRFQADAIDQYLAEKKRYEEELERYLYARRSRKQNQREDDKRKPDPPVPRRIICSDITTEALAAILAYSPRGLLLVRDELSGWIKGFDQYRKSQGADAAHFLSMHRAGDLLTDRKTGGEIISVRRAALSITGGIQPRILRRALGEEHLDNGLAARLLLAMPPRLPKHWTDDEISIETASRFSQLYSRLLGLEFSVDQSGNKIPIDLPLSPGGRDAWVSFFNQHGLEQAQREGHIAAAFSKLEGYCARFALIIHLIRCQQDETTPKMAKMIDSSSIEAGATLTTWFVRETERIYDLLGIAPKIEASLSIEEIVQRHGGRITARGLMQASRQYRESAESAHAALQQLVSTGHGMWITALANGGGRPSEVFVLHQQAGNAGNGNKTTRIRPQPVHPTTSQTTRYDKPKSEPSASQAGNRTQRCVTGKEDLCP